MDKSSKDNLVNEIENQLDDFFGDGKSETPADNGKISMERLKSIILSIDWEITDSCLSDLVGETNALMPSFESDRLTHTLLRMLNSLGRYIQKRKVNAHPDAIKRIMSVFASIEKLSTLNPADTKAKEKIIAEEIVAFKKLKQQVESRTQKASPPPQMPRSATPAAEESAGQDQTPIEKAVSEVEKRISGEVQKLKEQIATLQKEFDTLRKI